MSEYPKEFVTKDDKVVIAHSAIEANNFTNYGYRPKPAAKPEPETAKPQEHKPPEAKQISK